MYVIRMLIGACMISFSCSGVFAAALVEREAQETLTPVELDRGDTLLFTLNNGEHRSLTVESTEARIVLSNLEEAKKGFRKGKTIYEMRCRVRIDGHPMTMQRYVSVQQSFYEPYVVNGMRIWFDAVRDIDQLFNDNHGGGLPRKDVRFAIQDMTLPICPQPVRPWYPNAENYIDVVDSYNANDVWMGLYKGADLHGGLDVNMPIGTPLWAPIDFDTQFFFNSLEMGHNNNRWRGIRTWGNGQRWVLQAHHIVRLLVPPHTPIVQNMHYAEAAGILTGDHAHSHFVFKVGPEEEEIYLDAWILFWQSFENNKQRAGELRAAMQPVSPVKVGEKRQFNGLLSNPGITGNTLRYRWNFGDGGTSIAAAPQHVYSAPGIYPVTLTVQDGVERRSCTQHITVDDGTAVERPPALVLESPDAITFRRRPLAAMDVYGRDPMFEPCTLQFTARPKLSPRPAPQRVVCRNAGGGTLADPAVSINYRAGRDWLSVTAEGHQLSVAVDASRRSRKHGIYLAEVTVDCPGAFNSPQIFSVRMEVPNLYEVPSKSITVDNASAGCYATPWFWLTPPFYHHFSDVWMPGYEGDYLIHGSAEQEGEFVRYTPELPAGRYAVSLVGAPPVASTPQVTQDTRYAIRVRHKQGTETVWVRPLISRQVGIFEFDAGADGFVEILAEGSTGLVIADAVHFEAVEN
jgi:PKD repeat protein